MNLLAPKNISPLLELSLAESGFLLQLTAQLLREAKKSKGPYSRVSVILDPVSKSYLSDLASLLGQSIGYQIDNIYEKK